MNLLRSFTIICIALRPSALRASALRASALRASALRASASSASYQLDDPSSDIGSAGEAVAAVLNPMESKCFDEPCHEKALCADLGNGQFKCVCSEDLVGDGVHTCMERSPLIEVEPTSTEQRMLKKDNKKEKKKKTKKPTRKPTKPPTTVKPTKPPTTVKPTMSPTLSPTAAPTLSPTAAPTLSPTAAPTLSPTATPVTPAPVTPAPVTPAPVTPAPVTSAPVCFAGNALVMAKDKGQITMQDLQVGDWVRVAGGKFSPVVAFGHQASRISANFIRLHTNATKSVPLDISARHFVFLHTQQEYPVLAMSLKKGDVLLGSFDSSGLSFEPLEILKTEHVSSEGIFAPFTADGTIVVNGVVSSCYSFDVTSPGQASDFMRWGSWKIVPWHSFIHMRYSPLRLASLGISLQLGKLANDEGVNILSCASHQAHNWMTSSTSNWFVSVFGMVLLYLLYGVGIMSSAIEWLVGPSMGPMFIIVVLAAIAKMTIHIKNKSKKREQLGKYWSLTKHKNE